MEKITITEQFSGTYGIIYWLSIKQQVDPLNQIIIYKQFRTIMVTLAPFFSSAFAKIIFHF